MLEKYRTLIAVSIASLAFLVAAIFMAGAVNSKSKSGQSISVRGSATKKIVSDLGVVRGAIKEQGITQKEAYEKLQATKKVVTAFFAGKGIAVDKIDFKPEDIKELYFVDSQGRTTTTVVGYVCSQSLTFSSTNVQLIKSVSLEVRGLLAQGVNFVVDDIQYLYTKIADVKIEIQAAATKDALNRASRIAESADRKLGALKNAKMGVIQITPLYSNEVSDFGVNDVTSIEKEITAVINAQFYVN